MIGPVPLPGWSHLAEQLLLDRFSDLCRGGGRFGAHNINLNNMPEMSRVLRDYATGQFA